MNRSDVVRLVLTAALAGAAGVTFAQALEIIPLRHRTVEQVLPALQPLLEPGATLSGTRGQLFLRASPDNAAEIKRALAAIDQPLRRLVISVRFDDGLSRENRDLSVSGAVNSNRARVTVTAEDARRSAEERVDQRIQVLDGGRAFIAVGQSRPGVMGGATYFQETVSGFEVVPRLTGSGVLLEIAAQRPTQGLVTSATARLGEWVELGTIGEVAQRDARALGGTAGQGDARAIGQAGGVQASGSRRVSVKVEELPN